MNEPILGSPDVFLIIVESGMTLVIFWLLIYFLYRSLEPRFSKLKTAAGAIISFVLLCISLLGLILVDVTNEYAFVTCALVIIYIYALACKNGGPLVKFFWLLICFSFFVISNVATNALMLSLFGQINTTNVPNWAVVFFPLLTLILMTNFLRPITRKKMRLTRISPRVMIVLTLVPLISCGVLILFSDFAPTPIANSREYSLILFISSVGIGIIVYCTFAAFKQMTNQTRKDLKQQALLQQASLTEIHLDEVSSLYRETREWRHDYANNLQVMMGFVEAGKFDELKDYLESLGTSYEKISFRFDVGNELLNVVLNVKARRASEAGIAMSVLGQINSIDKSISPTDLASLIGNILDNAIEACQRIEQAQSPEITLQLSQAKNEIAIYEKNPTDGKVKVVDGALVSSKNEPGHGIGSTLIQAIVEKYNGYIDRRISESEFELFALLRPRSQRSKTS